MSNDSESCLVTKLSHYMDLDETAHNHLARLEEDEQTYIKGESVYEVGRPFDKLYVVKSGWFYSYVDMPDGRRQIIRMFNPGDIIGFPDMTFDEATISVRASEDGCLCPFPKDRLDRLFVEAPRLAALLFAISNRELTILTDTMQALGRMNARERIAFLFLSLISRLRVTNEKMTDTLRMPLSQQEIGDALGLTHTYVSKTLIEMERDGLIERKSGTVRLLREDRLASMIDFDNRYNQLDTSWMPAV